MSGEVGRVGLSSGFRASAYMFFGSDCEAAFRFYQTCGLGHCRSMVRYGDPGIPVANEAMRGKVMHASVELHSNLTQGGADKILGYLEVIHVFI